MYLKHLIEIFREVKRVLRDDGTLFVNLGDSYGTGSGSGIRKGKQSTNRGTQIKSQLCGNRFKIPRYK